MKLNKKENSFLFTKGTGAGEQHKNKVETCVVLTHLKTGLKEKCEDTRYKNKNLEIAYDRLIKKINLLENEKKKINNKIIIEIKPLMKLE